MMKRLAGVALLSAALFSVDGLSVASANTGSAWAGLQFFSGSKEIAVPALGAIREAQATDLSNLNELTRRQDDFLNKTTYYKVPGQQVVQAARLLAIALGPNNRLSAAATIYLAGVADSFDPVAGAFIRAALKRSRLAAPAADPSNVKKMAQRQHDFLYKTTYYGVPAYQVLQVAELTTQALENDGRIDWLESSFLEGVGATLHDPANQLVTQILTSMPAEATPPNLVCMRDMLRRAFDFLYHTTSYRVPAAQLVKLAELRALAVLDGKVDWLEIAFLSTFTSSL